MNNADGSHVDTAATRLLVVDDDQLSRQLLARALESHGFDVCECKDGIEALQVLEDYGPDLVVLDYEMPELNGAEVCEIIRQDRNPETAQIPIIQLTAHAGEEHEVECLKAGADDFVTKPVNTAILRARIGTHLRLRALRQQLQAQNRELEEWRKAHEFDLEAARLTQQAIIPTRMPALPGWSFSAHYDPLIQVGGDIYDWIRLRDNRLLVWIADATGHGVSAALVTTLTKLIFRHASSEAETPAEIMACVQRDYFVIFKGKSFMTAMCAVVDGETGEISVAGAGHPPMVLVRAGGAVELMLSLSPPIGLNDHGGCPEERNILRPGDAFLLYTDGLYSMNNAAGARMTQNQFLQMLAPATAPERFLPSLVDQVTSYAEGQPFPDDIAAVAGFRSV